MDELELRYDEKWQLPEQTTGKAQSGAASTAAVVIVIMVFIAPWLGWETPYPEQEVVGAIKELTGIILMSASGAVASWISVYYRRNFRKESK